ncbi:MAG: shikimate dehydrogenase [Puniceicoccales bacterium]|nr:shikimate dehydrogenase [Puniceicoccales bacterium]
MIHSLEDLRKWGEPGTHLAVLGHPIAHSLSPVMHNAALAALVSRGDPRFASWHYHKFDIQPRELPEALRLFHERGFRGLNLTLPHKVLALELAIDISPSGERAGAVNTLVATPSGWAGHNTDGEGFARALLEELGIPLRDADIVLLGAGGAARAVASTALAAGCRSLRIFNRSAGRLDELVRLLTQRFPESAGKIHAAPCVGEAFVHERPALGVSIEPSGGIPDGAIVVNSTSLGLGSGDPSPFPRELWGGVRAAFDIVYGAEESRFLRDARAAGVPTANGLPMLCWQGALALEIWTGHPAPADVMARALSKQGQNFAARHAPVGVN